MMFKKYKILLPVVPLWLLPTQVTLWFSVLCNSLRNWMLPHQFCWIPLENPKFCVNQNQVCFNDLQKMFLPIPHSQIEHLIVLSSVLGPAVFSHHRTSPPELCFTSSKVFAHKHISHLQVKNRPLHDRYSYHVCSHLEKLLLKRSCSVPML